MESAIQMYKTVCTGGLDLSQGSVNFRLLTLNDLISFNQLCVTFDRKTVK